MLYDGVGVILNLSAGAVAGRHHGVGVGSYLNLKHSQVFSDQDYRGTLRPDVVLLYRLRGPRSRRDALAGADSRVWTDGQSEGDFSCEANAAGTVMCPTGSASSLSMRRARVAAQYLGASSR